MKKVYGVWLLSICILPFLQGGYFYHEALFFGLIQGMVLLFLLFEKSVTFKLTGYRWMYLVLVSAGFLSFFTAIDRGMHLVGLLKLIVPFLFIINLDSFVSLYNEKVSHHLKLAYVFIASTMVSFLLIVLLFFDSNQFLFKYFVQGTRIGGFFQYANTFGLFIYGSLILLFISSIPNKVKCPISILLVSGIMLTQSRGILLILILTILLLVLFNTNRLRLTYLFSLVGIATGQLSLWWIKDRVDVFRGVALLDNRSEWLIRLLYYEDGLKMLKERLFGYGYLGYYYTHQYFQTGASYKVKFLHNSLLQFSLDYGIIAGIVILLIGVYGILLAHRGIRKDKFINVGDERIILLIGALGLFGHTLIDFDFQFMAFVILYFVMLHLMEYKYSENVKEISGSDVMKWMTVLKSKRLLKKNNQGLSRIEKISIGIVLLCILVFGYFASVSLLDYELNSIKAYEMYPYYTEAVDHLLTGKTNNEQVSEEEKLKIALDTVNRNPNYLNGFAFLRDYYYNNGDLETAINYAQTVYLLAPLRLDYYEIYTKISIEHILFLYKNNQLEDNNKYLLALLDMKEYMSQLESNRSNNYKVKHKVTFQLTEDMKKILDKAQEIYNTIEE